MGLVLYVVGACAALLALFFFQKLVLKRLFNSLDKIPTIPPSSFLFGSSLDIVKELPLRPQRRWMETYPDAPLVHYRWALNEDVVLVCSPDAAKHVLVTNERNFSKKHKRISNVKHYVGARCTGLVTMLGDEHAAHRKMVEFAFNYKYLKNMVPLFAAQTEKSLDLLRKLPQEEEFNMKAHMNTLTMNIIGLSGFEFDFEGFSSKKGKGQMLRDRFGDMLQSSGFRPLMILPFYFSLPLSANKKMYSAVEYFEGVVSDIIEQKRKSIATNDQHTPTDLLELLMMVTDDDGNHLDRSALVDHSKQFLLAGHETTSTLVSWVMYELSDNREVEEKCRKEIMEVLGDRPQPSAADLDQMTYLNLTIKEALRHYSPVPILVRNTECDDVVCGYSIPAGTRVVVSPYVLHHHPRLWDEPDRFDPERFLPEKNAKRHPFAYIPFLQGPRNCIGSKFAMLEAKIILSMMIREFSFERTKECRPKLTVTMSPFPNLMMKKRPLSVAQ